MPNIDLQVGDSLNEAAADTVPDSNYVKHLVTDISPVK